MIDIDRKNGKDGFKFIDDLKQTAGDAWEKASRVNTPSGGMHVYFHLGEGQQQCFAVKQGADVFGQNSGVDIRTGNAYVVAPPSRINGKAYRGELSAVEDLSVAPDALLELLFEKCDSQTPVEAFSSTKVEPLHTFAPDTLSEQGKERWRLLSLAKDQGSLDPEDQDGWLMVMMALAQEVREGRLSESEAWEMCDAWSKTTKNGKLCHNYNYEENHRRFMHALNTNQTSKESISFGSIMHRICSWFEEQATPGTALELIRQHYQGKPLPKTLALAALNCDWVFVRENAGKSPYHSLKDDRSYSEQGFKQLLKPTKIKAKGAGKPLSAAERWISWDKRREVDRVRFAPAKPSFFEDEGYKTLNSYRGLVIEDILPVKNPKQVAKPIIGHLKSRVCRGNEAHFKELLNLLAWWVQNPDKPGQKVIVLRGGQGTGKTLTGKIMLQIFTPYAMQTGASDKVTGQFNGHLEKKLFLLADEAFFAGSHVNRRRLKALITDEEITYEKKGQNAYTGKNHLRVFMTTNEEWAVPAEMDDRRFVMLDISPRKEGDDSYFAQLAAHIENKRVIAAFYHILKNRDIKGWYPSKLNVQTQAILEQKLATLGPVEMYIYEALQEERLLLDGRGGGTSNLPALKWEKKRKTIMPSEERKRAIDIINRRYAGKNDNITLEAFSKRAKQLVGAKTGRQKGERIITLPPLEESRRNFEKIIGEKIDWEG